MIAASALVSLLLLRASGCLPGAAAGPVQDIGVRPELLKDVGIDQKLNDSIPLDLVFRDENGRPVNSSQFFAQKPVILSLVYYNCPMLCTQVLNGLESSLKRVPMDIGKAIQRGDGERRSFRKARLLAEAKQVCTPAYTGVLAPRTVGIS